MLGRIAPQGRPEDYQTFQVSTPRDGGILTACKDAGCRYYREGWKSVVDERTELGRRQAHYFRYQSGRTITREQKTADGRTVFTFAAHQRCFEEHWTRPEIYVVRGGDWRGNPTGMFRQHANAADWVEDFAENQIKLADQLQQGSY
jgi:hypothetical protein